MSSKTVDKALQVLDMFTLKHPKWGLRELSRELDMSHTIVHRMLTTLEERGYVYRSVDTQKYELGIKLLELSNVVEQHFQISEIIHPIMHKIASETGESVVMTLLDNEEGVFSKIVESSQQVRFAGSVGRRSPLYIGASHKVILCHLPKDVQRRIVRQGAETHPDLVPSADALLQRLEEIDRNRWAYSAGETISDVAAVSIPLFDYGHKVLGSLSIAGPSYRLTEEVAQEILPNLERHRPELDSILSKVCFPTRRNFLLESLH
ncbi:IclR family transcriptional regulator [Halobacillus litoralis]|uniref:IclR family transcriptional regulator n=1 Tax=Halobacillus litoralis TaxID=45668 RepID=UPI001CD6A2C4|nr:IclR family transcriptional regulator [Halobacillus litoralis]MCA0970778.1 IclR family transcriptional regulator [Halobacillus litoralis]